MQPSVVGNHTQRVSDSRLPPILGKDIGTALLTEYADEHPQAQHDPHKWHMFCEIVMRDTFDVAGNRFVLAKDGSRFSGFDTIFSKLSEQGITGEDALETVLAHLPSYTKGFVQTPHPTEVLGRNAIEAEQALHAALEHNRTALNGSAANLLPQSKQAILAAMDALFNAIEPVNQPLTTIEEIARSVVFSEKLFDSVPITVEMLLDAAARHGAYNPGKPLEYRQLLAFNFLLQPETWSPGDRDSKSEMTADALFHGIALNKKAMALHYVKKLAEIIVSPETSGTDVKPQLREAMWKIMQDVNPNDIEDYINKTLRKNAPDAVIAEIEALHNIRFRHASTDVLVASGVRLEKGYRNHADFLLDLDAIRTTPGATFPKYKFGDGHMAHLSALDMLAIQANNFGSSALRSQIRENAEMHAEIMEMVLQTLSERGMIIPGYDPKRPETAHRLEVVDTAIERLMDGEKYPGLGNRMHEALIDKINSLRVPAKTAQDRQKTGLSVSPKEQNIVKMYETLKGFEIAATHPESIPRYLIAECKTPGDILEAFFLLKAMEPDESRGRTDVPRVEIVPLLETRHEVEQSAGILAQAYGNRYFHAHHRMADSNDPMLTIADRSTSKLRRMTVADAEQMYGLTVRAGDDQRLIDSTKLVMFAGSDITKSVGTAGAGLVMHQTNALRKALLSLPQPVLLIDYTGSGGGIHRSQPVSSTFETVQGRSMRQSPGSIAQKQTATLTHYLSNRMELAGAESFMQNDAQKRVLTAQLNLGNLAGLPFSEKSWVEETEKRLTADMNRYQTLYHSKEFSAYLGFTADPFVRLTSFAARSAARNRSKGDQGDFPPLVDVKNLRAIGYGAALNSSGSCASIYYGASEFLGLNHNGNIPAGEQQALVTLYLNDPIAQDRINRATYGIVMADFNAAWGYLGYTRHRDESGTVTLTRNGAQQSVATLATDTPELRQLMDKDGAALTREEKEQLAVHVLAKLDEEYQRTARGLLQLHRLVKQSAKLPVANADAKISEAEQLLNELPLALREQIRTSRAYLDPERRGMAGLFHEIAEGKKPKPGTRQETPYYAQIYHGMGTCFEYFENVPRAYTRPSWAIGLEKEALAKSGGVQL